MAFRDPKSKPDVIDRILSREFDGDLRRLGENNSAQVERIKKHVIKLAFPSTGTVFHLTVHKPRADTAASRRRSKVRGRARQEELLADNDDDMVEEPAPRRAAAARGKQQSRKASVIPNGKRSATRARMSRGNSPAMN